jgi:hypothetical protein
MTPHVAHRAPLRRPPAHPLRKGARKESCHDAV